MAFKSVVVMLHPHGQYDPSIALQPVDAVREGMGDMILASGCLIRGGPPKEGMPIYKCLAKRSPTMVQDIVSRLRLSEYHGGYQAYSRRLEEKAPSLQKPDKFAIHQQIIFQAVPFGFRIRKVLVATKYFEGASSVRFRQRVAHGLSTLGVAAQHLRNRYGIVRCPLFRE